MQNFNLSSLFLVDVGVTIAIAAAAAVVALALGVLITLLVYKNNTEKKIGSANERVGKIISDAEKEAERIKTQGKEAVTPQKTELDISQSVGRGLLWRCGLAVVC